MTWLNVSALTRAHLFKSAATYANKSLDNVIKAKEIVKNFFTTSEIEMERIKEEVWLDLSSIYYKYEDKYQKRAFREVIHEIFKEIKEDKWGRIYKKLHRIEKNRLFT